MALDLLAVALGLLAAALDLLVVALDLLVSLWWVFVSGSTVSARELVLSPMMVSTSSSLMGKANVLRTLGAGKNL